MPRQDNSNVEEYAINNISTTLAGLLALTAVNDHNRTVFTKETIEEATSSLRRFLEQPLISEDANLRADPEHVLGQYVTMAAHQLCHISFSASPTQKKKKHTWQALQAAAEKLHDTSRSHEESALIVSMVFGALSMLQHSIEMMEEERIVNDKGYGADAVKAVASALSSTISKHKPLRRRATSTNILRTFLIHAAHTDIFDLGILNHFAMAFKIGGGKEIRVEPHITASVIQNALRDRQDMGAKQDYPTISSKKRVSGALALACQLQPWPVLSPESMVDTAVAFEYWHTAEQICRTAHKAATSGWSVAYKEEYSFSQSEQQGNAKRAVEKLIDAAMEDRMYRRADSLATSLYEAGGRSRYVEARFNHACETISKVIHRKQIPVVDRQIERVDMAVSKVKQDANLYGEPTVQTVQRFDTSSSFDPSSEVRKFAIEKLEEAGDLTSAKRLAAMFGFDDYVYDERAIMLAAAMRRRRYLQYHDVLSGPIPSLITMPGELLDAFQELRKYPYRCGPFGLDAEWDEEIPKGAAVLQLANPERAILIDIPALLAIKEGVKAMESTVGDLLDCKDSVVAGFACRQDLSRLRASPFANNKSNSAHWLPGTRAVVDLQNLVGSAEPKLYKAGLSRVCQHFFHKPLDKAEQCSLWSARPLTEHQRSYAALDAWICVAIYQKLGSPLNGGGGKLGK
jgi:hypothetical protein